MYLDILRWDDLLNYELSSFDEIRAVCTTMLEWRLTIYPITFHILWVSVLFRYFLIKWADRGFIQNGKLNIELFKVSSHDFE